MERRNLNKESMLNLYLARHGEDQDNAQGILNGRRDTPLTSKGTAQAEQLAQKIQSTGLQFEAIYCSPLQRTQQTADILSKSLNGPKPIILEALIERDFGIMTGQKVSDIEKLCAPKLIYSEDITYFLEPKGAETFPQLLKRSQKALEQIQKENQTGNILVVTHGDLGKMLYASFYEQNWEEVLKQFHFDNADLLHLSKNSPKEEAHLFQESISI